ncbi:hypothetical protein SLH49_12465 [Cognatiyoonia sp. IB215446]|uniref:hypothetical protein n=1 Tax=Cognatiyoonia sp. IB215446 TaxID=3097355 RepID=UPI002A13B257|nr:hypothetical protein [Cognatiyoonia sp. IB215446]MDX8348795.1 hypothetical protein [Cognatiyoonia sp. IB215446]
MKVLTISAQPQNMAVILNQPSFSSRGDGFMRVFLLFCFALGLTTPSFSYACQGIRCVDKIERLYIHPDWVRIDMRGDERRLNCVPAEGVFVQLDRSNPGFDSFYAALLSAKAANLTVNLRIYENTNPCRFFYVMLE